VVFAAAAGEVLIDVKRGSPGATMIGGAIGIVRHKGIREPKLFRDRLSQHS